MRSRQEFKQWFRGISLPVYVCCMFLGLSSWLDISGLWIELPLLVNELPEGWNLPSYLLTIMQVGQLGPLIFLIANRCAPNKVKEWPAIFLIIGVGAVACLLLSFLWHTTTVVAEEPHSTALMALAAALAFVDTTSTVVFIGYMSIFKPQYMTGYYIGEGLCSLIPGLVGLGQGVGGEPDCVNTSSVLYNETTGVNISTWEVIAVYKEPNFSVQTFFLFLFAVLTSSLIAFAILHFAPFTKKEHVPRVIEQEVVPTDDNKTEEETGVKTISYNDLKPSKKHCTRDEDGRDHSKPALTNRQLAGAILLHWWMLFISVGCYRSIESYACLPYGNRVYSLSVRIGTIIDPIACLLSLFIPKVSIRKIAGLTFFGTLLFIYLLTLAIYSPHPPLQGQLVGEILVVCVSVLLVFTFTYARVAVVMYLQRRGGRRALIWNGGIGSLGVLCGSILMFLVINVFKLLTRSYACQQETYI